MYIHTLFLCRANQMTSLYGTKLVILIKNQSTKIKNCKLIKIVGLDYEESEYSIRILRRNTGVLYRSWN